VSDLLTIDDIAERMKLRREYVRDRLVKRPDFPRPCMQISQKHKRWDAADLTAWEAKQGAMNAR
jgi:predicted DNA-binding transcriptional regulator AlpA